MVKSMRSNCKTNKFIALSAPQPAFLVTVSEAGGDKKSAIAVSWATPLSVRPPLFGIVISPNKASHDVIKKAGVFTVNILPLEAVSELWWAGSHSGRNYEDKVEEAGLTSTPGKIHENAISVEEAIASFECKIVNEVSVGDRTLFVGEVVYADASKEHFDIEKGMWIPGTTRLIHHLANDAFLTNC
jgi:flavin reductase (DIM6/NTAB) family NADH-FMN oxidoreductase RutF